jgi:hypothetical protein
VCSFLLRAVYAHLGLPFAWFSASLVCSRLLARDCSAANDCDQAEYLFKYSVGGSLEDEPTNQPHSGARSGAAAAAAAAAPAEAKVEAKRR